MSGSETVRAYRHRKSDETAPRPARWRGWVFATAAAIAVAGFGSIVVQAGDNAGVYDIARQYTSSRGAPRFQMPQIFMPSRALPSSALGYAPEPSRAGMVFPATGKRALDRSRRNASIASRSGNARAATRRLAAVSGAEFREAFLKSRTSYCVRSCDGYFFPVGNADTASLQAHEAACARACPSAETSVYIAPAGGRGVEDAINRKGQRYQATLTAFNYRTQLDEACTCNATGGARNYSVLNDFTLRPGDMVMSREGLKVFRGTATFPYRAAHFGRTNTARLTAKERRFVEMSDAASLRGIGGARLPVTLQARVAAQLEQSRGRPNNGLARTDADATVALGDGRATRYVGPGADPTQTR